MKAGGNGTLLKVSITVSYSMKKVSCGRFWDMSQGQHTMLGHGHSRRHLDHVVPVGPLLQAGKDVPSPTQKPNRDRIQHTGRRPSFLGTSTDMVEFTRARSEEQPQLFFLATAPCFITFFFFT